jgi:hypothetical protein
MYIMLYIFILYNHRIKEQKDRTNYFAIGAGMYDCKGKRAGSSYRAVVCQTSFSFSKTNSVECFVEPKSYPYTVNVCTFKKDEECPFYFELYCDSPLENVNVKSDRGGFELTPLPLETKK